MQRWSLKGGESVKVSGLVPSKKLGGDASVKIV